MANHNAIPPQPWKEGQSGNPKGRPVNSITAALRELGEGKLIDCSYTVRKEDGKDETVNINLQAKENSINHAIGVKMLQMALAGDINAIKEVLNRTEGSTPQTVNTSNINKDVSSKLNFSKFNDVELEEYISHQKRMEEMERKIEDNE